ncbi:hypothetical protein HDU84_002686 [Entophlyctis sp. JEL0112]|nr:hypothetical protein HDU84_002686 [Entophlyctis sp. JEL0112]
MAQPSITFTRETILILDGTSGPGQAAVPYTLFYSSNAQLNQLFDYHTQRLNQLQVSELDENNDGISDFMIFTISIALHPFDSISRVRLGIFLRYDVEDKARLSMNTAAFIDESAAISCASLDVFGDLRILQRELLSPTADNYNYVNQIINYNLTSSGSETANLSWPRIVEAYEARGIRTKLEFAATPVWTSPRAINQPFVITGKIQYPSEVFKYKPTVAEVLKTAWIQYLSFFAVFYVLCRRAFSWAIESGLVASHVVVDVLPEKRNTQAFHGYSEPPLAAECSRLDVAVTKSACITEHFERRTSARATMQQQHPHMHEPGQTQSPDDTQLQQARKLQEQQSRLAFSHPVGYLLESASNPPLASVSTNQFSRKPSPSRLPHQPEQQSEQRSPPQNLLNAMIQQQQHQHQSHHNNQTANYFASSNQQLDSIISAPSTLSSLNPADLLSSQVIPLVGLGSVELRSQLSNTNSSLTSTASLNGGTDGSVGDGVRTNGNNKDAGSNGISSRGNLSSTSSIQMQKRDRGGSVDSARQQSVREDSTEIDDNDNAFEADDADDAAARKRRRNTEAARRSRQRKVQKIETLDFTVRVLQSEKKELEVRVAVLENEKATLLSRQKDLMERVGTLEQHLHEAHQAMLKMNSMK